MKVLAAAASLTRTGGGSSPLGPDAGATALNGMMIGCDKCEL
jgi:hypothetical protein